MKNLKKIVLSSIIMMVALITNTSKAQSSSTAELQIKTSAICDMCKTTIEKYMAFEKGVKKSTLDVDSKILTVIYDPKKTTPEQLRIAVSKSGYDADDVPADKKAYKKLDACCKKGAVCNDN
ncbi:hypothetical protein BH10BAC1_BH10BAC1_14130 [soil metagenome]